MAISTRSAAERIRQAMLDPQRAGRALLRRAIPGRRYGYTWHYQGRFITFKPPGFVAASSPPMLLARHTYEAATLRRLMRRAIVDRALEIGCGYGRLSPVIAECAREHVAMDINRSALALARTCYPGIAFGAASATELPFASGQFDRIVTWTVLQHIPPATINRAVAEILRVLRPGGSVILCEETRVPPTKPEHTWHRPRRFYEERFAPLRLVTSGPIAEIDRIPGMISPGEVMLFAPEPRTEVAESLS